MRPYYGPRFYRVCWKRGSETTTMNFGEEARSSAKAHAMRLAKIEGITSIRLESIDDRYPANVLETEKITREV